MTLKELHSEVCALGFDNYIECDKRLEVAANCALRMIFAERGVKATAEIFARDVTPISRTRLLRHQSGEELSLPLYGRAFSLRACGKGEIRITDGAAVRRITFDSEDELIRDFIKEGGNITFLGECRYTVYDLSFYGQIYGTDVASIPDGSGKQSYALGELIKDFRSFAEVARDRAGRPIPNAALEEGRLILDEGYEGGVLITYNRAPRSVDLSYPDEKIDIPCELVGLLPLATAAFICLDTDAEKSEYYSALYRRLLAAIDSRGRVGVCGEYTTNGWA